MPAAALLQKPKAEESERAPVVSATARSPIMPLRSPVPGRSAILPANAIQTKGFISSPDDAAEHEADRISAHVVAMPSPAPRASSRSGGVARAIMRNPLIAQRAPAAIAAPVAQGNIATEVKAAATGGFALSKKTRAFLEPRFSADFGSVRIHTDETAKRLSTKINARAFTFGRHIFFNSGEYNPDSKAGLQLLAHELTHTIQQSETIQRKAIVHERRTPQAQRIGNPFAAVADAVGGAIDAVGDAVGNVVEIVKDFAAEHADALPGFKMLCLVLGYNPINDAPVPGGGRAILKELAGFIPFGDTVYEALNNHGIIDKGGAFIDTQIANFKALANAIIGAISSFFGSLGPGDIVNPLGAWNRLKTSFTPVFASMKTFASGLVSGFVDLVREVILKPMARWAAANIPHWDLLMGVLGINPVSNDGESPTMQLIGAFMKLIGQEEVWENIKKGNAIGRAWAWFQTAMSGAKAMVSGIPGEVMATIRSFTIMDVLTVVGAAGKILGLFASIGGQFISWAGGTVIELLKIVIDVVAPGVMVYIQRAAGAFQTIVRNPVGFVGNLVRAAMQGFRQFASNFLTHLQASLVGWLTGAMGGTGVYIPRGLSLREILKFVLSVLGLTWANIRTKLVRATNETTVVALETGFDIVRTLVTEGPAAAWQQILETLSNLQQMAIDAIMDFVKQRVVQAAVTRLLSMLSPAGAFIQAVIAIYNTVMFFVERLRQIAQVAASFIDAIATIASGNIGPAANRVETTMAGLLTLVISFLARIAGLGRVADAVTGLIQRVRAPIDRALDRVVAWIVAQARRLGSAAVRGARGAVSAVLRAIGISVSFTAGDEGHRVWVDISGAAPQVMMASVTKPLSQHIADFQSAASRMRSGSKKTETTGAIGRLVTPVREIETRANEAKRPTTDVARRTVLDREIADRENAMRADLITILNNLKVRVPVQVEPVMIVTFVMGDRIVPSRDRGEYDRQLALQTAGINNMNVNQWLRNRDRFVQRGRDPRSATAQATARTTIRTAMEARLVLPESPNVVIPGLGDHEMRAVAAIFAAGTAAQRANGFSAGVASSRAGAWMNTQRALHSPDQAGGGQSDDITGMGAANVNSSIGSNWSRLAAGLEANVRGWLNGTGPDRPVAEEFWGVVRMNVNLTL
jgi:hypothetical protein